MDDLRGRVRRLIERFGAALVAQVCGISELMLLRLGAHAQVKGEVLVAVQAALPKLEGEGWAEEVSTASRKRAVSLPDLTQLSAREASVRDAIVADLSLSVIVTRPGTLAMDLCRIAPGVNIVAEVAKAGAWLRNNPANAKKNGARFLQNWLTSAQERSRPTLVPPPRGGIYGQHGPTQPASPETRRWKGVQAPPPPPPSGTFVSEDKKAG